MKVIGGGLDTTVEWGEHREQVSSSQLQFGPSTTFFEGKQLSSKQRVFFQSGDIDTSA